MKTIRLELSRGVYATIDAITTDEDFEYVKDMTAKEEREYWEDRALEYLESSLEDFKNRR